LLPDIIGYKLNKALDILRVAGFEDFTVNLTTPPREKDQQPHFESRVVRVVEKDNKKIEILICN